MAGYTRQSVADIINGAEITAPPINAEFNQLVSAFNAASGHSHDATTGNAPKINLTTSISGYLPAAHGGVGGKNKFDATAAPATSNDNTEGYAPGSMWENTTDGRVYICVGNSSNAAVWREIQTVIGGNKLEPATHNTIDLGTPTVRFQDLYLQGGSVVGGNSSFGGTLNVTGATALGSTLGVTGDTTLVNLAATGTTTITSIDLNSGAIDSTTIGTTTPAAGTFTTLNANTSLVAATADINGGSVDGATIGASTPSTGSFTTLGASGTSTLATVDINGGNIDGTAIGAAVQSTGAFTTVSTSGQATLATVDINGGSIDGTAIGGNSTSSGAFTTLSASGGITGDIVGNVTGNSSGTHTGAVVGNVTGNLTGNVTSSGTSSFNNVTVDGTLNMNAGTTATITNLTDPTNAQDAATKAYVDGEISTLIGDAGAGLNTLGELADALNDDDDFSTTVTNSIATKLPLAGGTLTGAIAMSNNKVTGLGSPSVGTDASTKDYVDTQRNTRVAKTGDTMSGALAMGSNKITGLGTPTAGTDASTKAYVDGILGSATASSASASAAATSESNAATSETNAASSASAAAADRATVASLYDSFDDRYLGPKSSAPTQDNDGNALVVGALYFNNTNNIMYVYGSGGWQAAGSSVNGTSDRQTYTATAGQTVFAATYDAGYVDVYLNGVKLLAGTDFTATNGTSVTLASGASVNDVVDIVAYGTFVLADHLTQTQSDARYVNLSGDTMTGALTTTGLTVDGVSDLNGTITVGTTYTTDITGNNISFFRNNGASYIQQRGGHSLAFQTNDGSDRTRLNISNNGDISFYEDTGTTPKFYWDASAESLGIGTSSPYASNGTNLEIYDASTIARLSLHTGSGKHWGIGSVASDSRLSFYDIDSSSEAMAIDSSGNVGIGTSSPFSVNGNNLHVQASSSNARAILESSGGSGRNWAIQSATDGSLNFYDLTGSSEAMRIDSSQNLLVGKTATTEADVGHTLGVSGYGYATADGGICYSFNRKTSDGDILRFRKDLTTVGVAGAKSDDLYITTGDTGIRFNDGNDQIWPVSSSGTSRDAAIDLGASSNRFKNVFLSEGVYLGGTGAANKLEDYETGYFEPNIQPTSGSITWISDQNKLSYTKIGRVVHITGQLAVSSVSSPSGITRGSLPFTQLNQDEQSERTTGVVLVQNTSLNVNEFGIYPNGGSDTHLEIVRTNATSVQRDAGSYFNSSTVLQFNYTYVAA